jgi:hypothetical protein
MFPVWAGSGPRSWSAALVRRVQYYIRFVQIAIDQNIIVDAVSLNLSGRIPQPPFDHCVAIFSACGEGTDEYKKPVEFFRRTYLTESLKQMLVGAVRRVSGQGGDPVVQLQTNFGGGKTHSMLALYHLFSGTAPTELAGIDAVLHEADTKSLPTAKRVVLVGNKISPGNPVKKADGTMVRTLWGELAWQQSRVPRRCSRRHSG